VSVPVQQKKAVTLIPGDGIGPECVDSARQIVDAAGVGVAWEVCHAGESVFKQGVPSGVPEETIESIRRTRCVLKGPLGTPVGYGEKSANVTLRKLFETFANVRPVRELPGVPTPYTGRGIDLVVVRENVEDLYAGIEHMQTPGVAQCLKLISRKGCEKVVRLAFELARAEGRKSVACATKSNIMKLTEGTLKRTFEEVAKEYPDVQAWHVIVDNCAHQLVKKPEQFDVIVTTNMNGDILSDLTSALVGGLGFAPSANIGSEVAIFEAVHGSAPKYAGKNVINPTAVILSSVMMLKYLGEFEAAELMENAVLATLAEGNLMGDVAGYPPEGKGMYTSDYTKAIIANLGKKAEGWTARKAKPIVFPEISRDLAFRPATTKEVHGADIFVDSSLPAMELGPKLEAIAEGSTLRLKMISNRGTKVYPDGNPNIDQVAHHRCRFVSRSGDPISFADALTLAQAVNGAGIEVCHIERLLRIDGADGFTKAQGED
jgi:isocitrate dehydrogenase